MKKKYIILLSTFTIVYSAYFIDRTFFMKERVLRHQNWEIISGNGISGDFIDTKHLTFKEDTMFFNYNADNIDTLLFKSQYFNNLTVINPSTRTKCKYTMKGANWTDYLFK